jgi:ATP/ADP translocase
MKESLKVLLSSRYVRDLATLVVAYGISINLVEVTWKSKLKAQVTFLAFSTICSFHIVLFLQ